ncbi:MAG: nodulation protein NfeD [Bryobacteraceae bacterium]
MRPFISIALLLAAIAADYDARAAGPQPRIISVSVDGVIHPITTEIIAHALEQAKQQQASAVLITLSTPGGLLDATREIVESITASPIPVITYVTPSGARAASAGFFILEAGDLAAMAPGTNTGASSPVLMGQQMDPVMRSKIENDASALLRGLTSRRGRNAELAEQAVRQAKAWTDKEALDNHLIDLIAANETQLFQQLDGREITLWSGRKTTLHLAGAEVVEANRSWRETLINAIADPNIGFILFVLGALGIYVEFTAPGTIFPGVAGGILVLLALSSLAVLPISWVGVALLALSIALFVLEAKFASHGILGAGGTVAMILGAVLLVNGPPEMRIHWLTAISVAIPFALITLFLVSIVVRARANKVITGQSGMIDTIGIVQTPLAPEGKILIRGELWDAISPTPADVGAQVRVTSVDGLRLHVEPVGVRQTV